MIKANHDSQSGQNLVLVSVMGGKREKNQKGKKVRASKSWVLSIKFAMLGDLVPNLKCKQATIVEL